MGVFGIIIASLVNSSCSRVPLQFAISVIGVLVFAGLTAYDTAHQGHLLRGGERRDRDGQGRHHGCANLYLDL